MEINGEGPLSAGDPLRAHFPAEMEMYHYPDGIKIRDPGKTNPLFYHKAPCGAIPLTADRINGDANGTVQDVIVVGEVGILRTIHVFITRLIRCHPGTFCVGSI